MVFLQIKYKRQKDSHKLTKDSSHGSSNHFHAGEAKIPENQDRIHNNVDDGPCSLCDHIIDRFSGGLQQPFKCNLHKDTHREYADNGHVLRSVFDNSRIVCLKAEENTGSENTDQGKDNGADQSEENTIPCSQIGAVKIFSPRQRERSALIPTPVPDDTAIIRSCTG